MGEGFSRGRSWSAPGIVVFSNRLSGLYGTKDLIAVLMGQPQNEEDLVPSLSRLAVSRAHDSEEEKEAFHDCLEASAPQVQDNRGQLPPPPQFGVPPPQTSGVTQSPPTDAKEASPALSGSLMFSSVNSLPEKPIARNVSFIKGSGTSVAYKEHNPPAILRQTDATCDEEPAVPNTQQAALRPTASTSSDKKENEPKSKPKVSKDKRDELHILIGVTGSVATIKVGPIIRKLKQIYHERAIIQLVATKASCVFFKPADVPRDVKIWYDEDEWNSRGGKVDSQLHMELRRWADILLVAPCSANTLAKLTYGICDNLLTSVFRVWNPAVPLLVAPAMNTHMYTNPVTKRHFKVLKDLYQFVEILKPVEKVLVCGDIGMGGMREWTDIVQILVKKLGVAPDDEVDDKDDS